MGFQVRSIAIAAGSERRGEEAEWRDALVVVEQGTLELETRRGVRVRFAVGDVLFLASLELRAVRPDGAEPVRLALVTRSRGHDLA